jgi:hypothetical protein
MKRFLLLLISIFAFLSASAQSKQQLELADNYLKQYADYAVTEMQRSGVPASITLAQGMLESNYGRSELTTKANNHFGIQCGKYWEGKRVEHMDNGELRQFRKYGSALESYEDHSNFLIINNRYRMLFELEPTDYKGWAHGLKKAGYAEDPAYADKLIKIIEMYDLSKYDVVAAEAIAKKKEEDKKAAEKAEAKAAKEAKKAEKKSEEAAGEVAGDNSEKSDKSDKKEKKEKEKEKAEKKDKEKKEKKAKKDKKDKKNNIEHTPFKEGKSTTTRYTLSRVMYSQNGVPFIYAYEDETYKDIAAQYDLFLRELLSFNDVQADTTLKCGDVVYIQAKKRKAAKGCDEYRVEGEISMQEISQMFGIKLKSLYRMNDIDEDEGYVPSHNEIIILR